MTNQPNFQSRWKKFQRPNNESLNNSINVGDYDTYQNGKIINEHRVKHMPSRDQYKSTRGPEHEQDLHSLDNSRDLPSPPSSDGSNDQIPSKSLFGGEITSYLQGGTNITKNEKGSRSCIETTSEGQNIAELRDFWKNRDKKNPLSMQTNNEKLKSFRRTFQSTGESCNGQRGSSEVGSSTSSYFQRHISRLQNEVLVDAQSRNEIEHDKEGKVEDIDSTSYQQSDLNNNSISIRRNNLKCTPNNSTSNANQAECIEESCNDQTDGISDISGPTVSSYFKKKISLLQRKVAVEAQAQNKICEETAVRADDDDDMINHQHDSKNIAPESTSPSIIGSFYANSTIEENSMGEIQINLDIAAAKLLTEEMKCKNLKELYEREVEIRQTRDRELELLREKGENAPHSSSFPEDEFAKLQHEISCLKAKALDERHAVANDTAKLEETKQNDIEQLKGKIEFWKHRAETLERNEKQSILEIELENTSKKLDETTSEFDYVKKDFRLLCEEADSLEKELEAVSEDRDNLLRRHANATKDQIGIQEQWNELEKQRIELKENVEDLDMKRRELDDIDLSRINLDDSILPEADKLVDKLQKDCDELNSSNAEFQGKNEFLNREIKEIEAERDQLKICLDDSLIDLDKFENEAESIKKLENQRDRMDKRVQELSDLLRSRNQEVTRLKNKQNMNKGNEGKLEERLIAVAEFLTSMNTSENVTNSLDDEDFECSIMLQDDVPSLKSIYFHAKNMQEQLSSSEDNLGALLKREQQQERRISDHSEDHIIDSRNKCVSDCDIVKSLSQQLQESSINLCQKEKEINEIRKALQETVGLIGPLKKSVSKTEKENNLLQSKLSAAMKKAVELDVDTDENKKVQAGDSAISSDLSSKLEKTNLRLERTLKHVDKLAFQLSATKKRLKEKEESNENLNMSLDQSVEMLSTLQGYVEACEKKTKHAKKQLKLQQQSSHSLQSASSHTETKVMIQGDKTTIIRKLERELYDSTNQYECTKNQLNELSETNKFLLVDLKSMECEELRSHKKIEEMENQLQVLHSDLENSKCISASALLKIDEMAFHGKTSVNSESAAQLLTLTKSIGNLQDQLHMVMSKNEKAYIPD